MSFVSSAHFHLATRYLPRALALGSLPMASAANGRRVRSGVMKSFCDSTCALDLPTRFAQTLATPRHTSMEPEDQNLPPGWRVTVDRATSGKLPYAQSALPLLTYQQNRRSWVPGSDTSAVREQDGSSLHSRRYRAPCRPTRPRNLCKLRKPAAHTLAPRALDPHEVGQKDGRSAAVYLACSLAGYV